MSIIDELTVSDFKELFARNFPYIPYYETGKVYFTGDEVYEAPNFYTSLVDENVSDVSYSEEWKVTNDSPQNYVLDCDIERAWQEALATFNISLGGDDQSTKVAFLYLVAFYLAYDLSLANGGAYGNINFPATSVTVGSVSESYYVPKAYLEDPVLSFYARNGFGLKYLNMVYPKLIGNARVVAGWSLP